MNPFSENDTSLLDLYSAELDVWMEKLDVSSENGMPPVISRRGWLLPMEALKNTVRRASL